MVRVLSLLVVLIGISACATLAQPPEVSPLPNPVATLASPGELTIPSTPEPATHPLLTAYLAQVKQALTAQPPILLLHGLDPQQEMAQTIVLSDTRLLPLVVDQQLGTALRMEVFGVVPLRESDRTQATTECSDARCYRVEIYNFARNTTIAAVANLDRQRVVTLDQQANTQPDIPPHLTDIAREIAVGAPDVERALGYAPSTNAALMANTKTSLNRTRCERSAHLCVAPTFVDGDRALWAIVDLTAGMLVGIRWTTVGSLASAVTEKDLQNEAVLKYCDTTTHIERDGWSFDYMLTSSDGLRISDVSYQGRLLIQSAKLVDWHVSYSEREGFGYSDAVGCPYFSQAAVIAIHPPEIEELREGEAVVGFTIEQEFWSELWPQPCNYYYEQAFEFYLDGRFRPAVASVGRGCGDDGTYRPVTRIALAGDASFASWDGDAWQDWATERWQGAADRKVDPGGAEYRVMLGDSGFTIATGRGQFGDGGRGDSAYVYVTRQHADRDEGESDMLTIGPCCNTDERQGPEQFIGTPPEPIGDTPLVLWYVAQLENDGRPGQEYCWADMVLVGGVYVPREHPCWSGPLLQPLDEAGQ